MSLLLAMTEVKKCAASRRSKVQTWRDIEIVGGVVMIYNEIQGVPTFHVGDKVMVMRNTEMAYNWSPEMDCFDGIYTVIEDVVWDYGKHCYLYHIRADNRYIFDASCFMLEPDIETEGSPCLRLETL